MNWNHVFSGLLALSAAAAMAAEQPNVLIVTVDDMSADSIGLRPVLLEHF